MLEASPLGIALYYTIEVYIWALFIYIMLSWVSDVSRKEWYREIGKTFFEPVLKPLREVIPSAGGLDLSPIVLFFGLILLQMAIRSALL